MFFDLNIPRHVGNTAAQRELILAAMNHGYNAVAITTEVNEGIFDQAPSKKKKLKVRVTLPGPVDLAEFDDIPIRILNRINIFVTKPETLQKFNKMKALKQYDIVSYLPGSDEVLKILPNVPDFDVLSFNPAISATPLYWHRKLYKQFVQNGVFMELPYAPLILDSTHRKYSIFLSHVYHSVGKSANIIVTSSATNAQTLRSPYDVINLCTLFGLSEEQAKYSITRHAATMIIKSRTRRRGKNIMEITIDS